MTVDRQELRALLAKATAADGGKSLAGIVFEIASPFVANPDNWNEFVNVVRADATFSAAERSFAQAPALLDHIERLEAALREIGLAANLSVRLSDPDEAEPWRMIEERARLALNQEVEK
jgi:hypothetical protein